MCNIKLNHTARVQEEAHGFQRAVQDNAQAIIAQRINQEASAFQNILNGNTQQRDEEYMQLIRSRDEEYVSSMAAVTAQRESGGAGSNSGLSVDRPETYTNSALAQPISYSTPSTAFRASKSSRSKWRKLGFNARCTYSACCTDGISKYTSLHPHLSVKRLQAGDMCQEGS
eukprot:1851063-Amphidinium_carterae.2